MAALRERLRPGEVVLVKGSQYRHRIWEVADWLRESTTEPAGDEMVAR